MDIKKSELISFCKAYDTVHLSCFVLNQKLEIQCTNDYAIQSLGLSNEILIGKFFNDVWSKLNYPIFIKQDGKIITSDPMKLGNKYVTWNTYDLSVDDESMILLLQQDKTELVNLNEQLEKKCKAIIGYSHTQKNQSAEHYFTEISNYFFNIIDKIPCYVYWKSTDLKYLGCNKLAADFVELSSPSDIIGKSDFDIFKDPVLAKSYRDTDQKILKTGVAILNEIGELSRSNGEIQNTLVNKVPLKDESGNIVGLVGITVDITELIKAKIAAEAGERAKTAFIANMSHDLRTPLAGIVGEANLLKEELNDEEQKEHAIHLAKSGTKLLSMYNEIIEDVTSGNMSEQNIENTTFDIVALASDLQDLEMPTLITKGLKFSASIEQGIPTFLVSDRRKIERIIENLLGNAIKFTQKGHIDLKIELLEKQENTVKLKFNIIDTGIGVPEASKSKLFERFYKVSPSYKGEYQGFGLGLDIAKNYTHILGGTIGFESTEGVGSDFYIILSLQIASEDEINLYKKNLANKPSSLKLRKPQESSTPNDEPLLKEAPISPAPDAFADTSDAPHILVIEDNFVARSILITLLKSMKLISITAAEDGETALALVKTQQFDLILSDVGLPGISGIDFTRAFRSFEKEHNKTPTPIVAVTAHATDGRDECLNAGMDGAVAKPVTSNVLSEIIATFLPDFKITNQT